jgi:hypothetical protein
MSYVCSDAALLLIAAVQVLPSLLLLLPLQFAAFPLHTALAAATANVYSCKTIFVNHT